MRLPITAAALTVGLSMLATASPAAADLLFGRRNVYEGAWCARMNTAAGRVEEDCTYDSFERCRQMVIAGNRGFCTQNPAYAGQPQQRRYKRKLARKAIR
jgi:hypothetical protein